MRKTIAIAAFVVALTSCNNKASNVVTTTDSTSVKTDSIKVKTDNIKVVDTIKKSK